MSTNASIFERNICHAFEGLDGGFGAIAEESFWRFRNAHTPRCAERLAYLMADCAAAVWIAVRTVQPLLPDTGEREAQLRIRIELDDFIRERIHHQEDACVCREANYGAEHMTILSARSPSKKTGNPT